MPYLHRTPCRQFRVDQAAQVLPADLIIGDLAWGLAFLQWVAFIVAHHMHVLADI
jgi:hypothetical protein